LGAGETALVGAEDSPRQTRIKESNEVIEKFAALSDRPQGEAAVAAEGSQLT
jgi:hypothetical protein